MTAVNLFYENKSIRFLLFAFIFVRFEFRGNANRAAFFWWRLIRSLGWASGDHKVDLVCIRRGPNSDEAAYIGKSVNTRLDSGPL